MRSFKSCRPEFSWTGLSRRTQVHVFKDLGAGPEDRGEKDDTSDVKAQVVSEKYHSSEITALSSSTDWLQDAHSILPGSCTNLDISAMSKTGGNDHMPQALAAHGIAGDDDIPLVVPTSLSKVRLETSTSDCALQRDHFAQAIDIACQETHVGYGTSPEEKVPSIDIAASSMRVNTDSELVPIVMATLPTITEKILEMEDEHIVIFESEASAVNVEVTNACESACKAFQLLQTPLRSGRHSQEEDEEGNPVAMSSTQDLSLVLSSAELAVRRVAQTVIEESEAVTLTSFNRSNADMPLLASLAAVHAFQGGWELASTQSSLPDWWLISFYIVGRVFMHGDTIAQGDEAGDLLKVREDDGVVLLAGGELSVDDDGNRLSRMGKSGTVLEFQRVWLPDSEDEDLLSIQGKWVRNPPSARGPLWIRGRHWLWGNRAGIIKRCEENGCLVLAYVNYMLHLEAGFLCCSTRHSRIYFQRARRGM